MSLYSEILFPCVCDFLMDHPGVRRYRRELLAQARGEILEIGFGTGLNLPLYPPQVHKITAVDPNKGMLRRAQKRIQQAGIEVDQKVLDGERLPFADSMFDCVVSTWTLCSIERVDQSLREVYRVLKAGGQFLFLEHGLSPDPSVQKWQRHLNWLQMRLGDGCRLNRNIRELVASQPFSSVAADEFYMEEMPRTHGYMFSGAATK